MARIMLHELERRSLSRFVFCYKLLTVSFDCLSQLYISLNALLGIPIAFLPPVISVLYFIDTRMVRDLEKIDFT